MLLVGMDIVGILLIGVDVVVQVDIVGRIDLIARGVCCW